MSPTVDWTAWKNHVLSRVDPRHTAFVIIDLQNDFCADWGALANLGSDVSPCQVVADRLTQFLPAVRNKVALVAFFRLEYDPARLSESQRERLIRDGKPVICVPGTPGSELFVPTAPSDHVFVKHRYSIFTSEAFRELLTRHSIDTVVVAGVDTHICVEGSIRHGYDLGYRMLVLSDLVATRRSELARHENALTVCEHYFGLVIDRAVFLDVLNSSGAILTVSRRT